MPLPTAFLIFHFLIINSSIPHVTTIIRDPSRSQIYKLHSCKLITVLYFFLQHERNKVETIESPTAERGKRVKFGCASLFTLINFCNS